MNPLASKKGILILIGLIIALYLSQYVFPDSPIKDTTDDNIGQEQSIDNEL